MAKKKPIRKKKSRPAPKPKTRTKVSARGPQPRGKKPAPRRSRTPASSPTSLPSARIHQGVGLSTGGQSGDTQGLSTVESADSESVEELVEEGQDYEASVISGVENALDPDESEVTTKEVPEDDVLPEYRNQDPG